MGQLQRRVLPHPDTGRNPFQHRPLRCPDQCAGAGGKIVLFQINAANQPVPHPVVGLRALQIDQAVRQRLEYTVCQIALHGCVDARNAAVDLRTVQIGLRQHQPQSGGRISHNFFRIFPVFRLGGKLITGHHRPFFHFAHLRQQNIRRKKGGLFKSLVHAGTSSIYNSKYLYYNAEPVFLQVMNRFRNPWQTMGSLRITGG